MNVLYIFQGSCFQIACNKHGSRTIEGIFKASSIKSKFVIAETLAERESHLLSHTFGRFVHRNLSLGHLRNRKQEWKSIQMKEAQKRKLFADIVGREPSSKKRQISIFNLVIERTNILLYIFISLKSLVCLAVVVKIKRH